VALELVNQLPYDHPYRWDGTLFGGPKLWRPDELGADLALWLDAEDTASITLNGSTVSQWNDKSGNGRNATQATEANQPAYLATDFNGKPSVTWTSINKIMQTSAFAAQSFYFATRYSNGTQATWVTNFPGLFGGDSSPIGLIGTASGADVWYNVNIFNTIRRDGGSEENTNTSSLVALPIPNGIISARAASAQTPSNTWKIGNDRALTARGWTGPIAEVIATSAILSTEDRQKLEGYLAWKWGLAANLPADHPYKLNPPTV
jgi:hypothetical protein